LFEFKNWQGTQALLLDVPNSGGIDFNAATFSERATVQEVGISYSENQDQFSSMSFEPLSKNPKS